MRSRVLLATVVLFAAIACGGGADKATPAAGTGAVPTATPFATVPEPAIVTATAAGTPARTPTPSTTPGSGTPAGEQVYTVVAGDVLGLIADRFDVPPSQIRALNNLTGDSIQIGQKLRIPARAAGASPTATPATSAQPGGVTTYTVKAGDTGFGIALEFDTTVEALERANGMAKGGLDRLQLGQVVKLPPPGQR